MFFDIICIKGGKIMCKASQHDEAPKTKTVGGAIPEDLYWQFKKTSASRKEGATQALINAIRLYNEIDTAEGADINE